MGFEGFKSDKVDPGIGMGTLVRCAIMTSSAQQKIAGFMLFVPSPPPQLQLEHFPFSSAHFRW